MIAVIGRKTVTKRQKQTTVDAPRNTPSRSCSHCCEADMGMDMDMRSVVSRQVEAR